MMDCRNIPKALPPEASRPFLWTLEKSEVESCEHQDNADVHRQPFPESVSEERDIYTNYDGHHHQHVKHDAYLSAHIGQHSPDNPMLGRMIALF